MSSIPALDIVGALHSTIPSPSIETAPAGIGVARTDSTAQAGSAAADFEAHFGATSSMSVQGATPAALPIPVQHGHLIQSGAGSQILDGLEKLGRSVQSFNNWGSGKAAVRPATMTSQAPQEAVAATGAGGSQEAGSNPMGTLWSDAMYDQEQMYATAFNVQLVMDSSESLMKALKSLLTQGGG